MEILSGVFEGKTTGAPISMIVWNEDRKSKDYTALKEVYRPGHADLAYDLKWGHRDYRGGGRSSGRETACRVMGGVIAKKLLHKKSKTEVRAYPIQIGPHVLKGNKITDEVAQYIEKIRSEGDSVGGIVEIRVTNPPVGLGEPCFDKLHAVLGQALLSIGTVKGFEIGSGFNVADMRGSQNNDEYVVNNEGRIDVQKNYSGGIQGGISIGSDIVMRIAVKPPSSIAKPQATLTRKGEKTQIAIEGRHDACIVLRVLPVAEAMVALILVDYYMKNLRNNIYR